MRVSKIGIVGGGPGGLMTAYSLQKLTGIPIRMTIFEASDRVGGKILSPQFRTTSACYEAGAAELYDYTPVDEDPLKELIAELGLSTRPMEGSSVIMNHRILSNLDDIEDAYGSSARTAVADFDRRAKDYMNPLEFYTSDHIDLITTASADIRFDSVMNQVREPKARVFLENLIHSDLATEPERTNVTYGMQNYLMNDRAYMRLYSIEGGNECLPRELAARISAEIKLEHAVNRVARDADGSLQVTSTYRSELRQDQFDYVVIALPNNCLPTVTFEGKLAEALERHKIQYDFPAHYLRITILFDRPFWREHLSDSYWMLDAFGGCCLYDESSRDPGAQHSILGWLIAGEAARTMSELDDSRLIAEALKSLPDFLKRGTDHLIEGSVHRWIGAVNAIPGGVVPQNLDRRHQPDPVEHPNLFVVGDYLFDSTLNGVLDSAEYVAGWIAANLADASGANS